MNIQFVCSGNTYRSRLAEAYLNSKQFPGITVSSSGVRRDDHYNNNGPIAWYAMRLIKNNHLIPFMNPVSTQTTEKLLLKADLLIFFGKNVYDYAKEHFKLSGNNYRIWDISDLVEFRDDEVSLENEIGRIKATSETFEKIKQYVDTLIKEEKLS